MKIAEDSTTPWVDIAAAHGPWRLEREGILGKSFQLTDAEGALLARIVWPSVWKQSFEVQLASEKWLVKQLKWWSQSLLLQNESGSQQIELPYSWNKFTYGVVWKHQLLQIKRTDWFGRRLSLVDETGEAVLTAAITERFIHFRVDIEAGSRFTHHGQSNFLTVCLAVLIAQMQKNARKKS